jgi:hypothetical protein
MGRGVIEGNILMVVIGTPHFSYAQRTHLEHRLGCYDIERLQIEAIPLAFYQSSLGTDGFSSRSGLSPSAGRQEVTAPPLNGGARTRRLRVRFQQDIPKETKARAPTPWRRARFSEPNWSSVRANRW